MDVVGDGACTIDVEVPGDVVANLNAYVCDDSPWRIRKDLLPDVFVSRVGGWFSHCGHGEPPVLRLNFSTLYDIELETIRMEDQYVVFGVRKWRLIPAGPAEAGKKAGDSPVEGGKRTGKKHYVIIKKAERVKFGCNECGCVYTLPLDECGIGEEFYAGAGHVGEHKVYRSECPECGNGCSTWAWEHRKTLFGPRGDYHREWLG